MTALRLISLPLHSAVELAVGLALIAAGFGLAATPAGLVLGVSVGALIVGLALAGAARDPGTHSLAAHLAYDRLLALGALTAAVALATTADRAAAVALIAAALVQLGLSVTTRYTARA